MARRLALVALLLGALLPGGAQAAPERAEASQLVPRPLYPGGEEVVQTRFVVVHYTLAGPDRPPPADADADGVPDYVAVAASAAETAWLSYARGGFKEPLEDSAGPNAKLDVYVVDLPGAVDGAAIAPRNGVGGGFMLLDNSLQTTRVAAQSLQQTVAHELFHMFQYAYVPDGTLPRWAAEGSATAMQLAVFPQIREQTTQEFVRHFLAEPWRSLYDERAGCDHCYGGALWWAFLSELDPKVLPAYFGRLYGYAKLGRPLADGLQPLGETLARRRHGSFFTVFGRFTLGLYRSRLSPGFSYRLRAAGRLRTTPPHRVRGASAHYVPISVPTGAPGIALRVTTLRGPKPDVKLVVGGPGGRAVAGSTDARGRVKVFGTSFRSARERRNVMLIVTSGRKAGTSYRVAFEAAPAL